MSRRRRITPTSTLRENVYAPPARNVVERWSIDESRERISAARTEAAKIEGRMRELVKSVPPVDDPNVLLENPKIGLELRRLAKAWFRSRAILWRIEGGER